MFSGTKWRENRLKQKKKNAKCGIVTVHTREVRFNLEGIVVRDFDIDDYEFDASVFEMEDDFDAYYTADYGKKKGRKAKKLMVILLALILLAVGVVAAFLLFFVRPPARAILDPQENEIFTLLIAGQDDVGSFGLSDTIMLVSLDVTNSTVHVVSIPRDTKVDESWAMPKINSVYAMTGGSAERLVEAVGAITGFLPDNYIILDMQAFTDLVNVIDGIYFDVPRYMRYDDPCQNLHINLQPGYQRLDGEQALHLVRWRQNNDGTGFANGDLGRIETQQNFMQALAAELLEIRNPLRIGNIARVFVEHVETDLSLGNLMWFAQQFMGIDSEDINVLMIPNAAANIGGVWYQVIQLEGWLEMVNTHLNPSSREVREENLRVFAWKNGVVQQLGEGRTLIARS